MNQGDLISRAISELRLAARDLEWIDARDHDSEHLRGRVRTRIEDTIERLEMAEDFV